ncbi:response regulator transcription factor [Pseudovibrio sp. WM33]|uniref:response regulator transcription factor n=1 Tax=Pseudovibrio sp. WM33 TaxID=1735585 RepID=UPI0007AEA890|nr:response regulator transcription factor [Pseudovibrio sp. WM33]KZL24693.1 hypothetical protein PsWM33_02367 [Pseudovibrio sp. WM33]
MTIESQVRRILVIDSQDLMRQAIVNEFKVIFDNCLVFGVQTPDLAKSLLSKLSFDLISIEPGLSETDPTSTTHRLAMIANIVANSSKSKHLVITANESEQEAKACQQIGVIGYASKVGLTRRTFKDLIHKINQLEFVRYITHPTADELDICSAALTPREQEIISLMFARSPGVKRKDVYEQMGVRCGIDACSVEKYFKQARTKLQKNGTLPSGL